MPPVSGRLRKGFAIALIFLNLSGARVISVTEAFAGSRTYFTADRGVKAILKAATKQTWRKKGGLCVSDVVRSAKTLQKIGSSARLDFVPAMLAAGAAIDTGVARPGPLRARRLPLDISPVQPPQLYSKL